MLVRGTVCEFEAAWSAWGAGRARSEHEWKPAYRGAQFVRRDRNDRMRRCSLVCVCASPADLCNGDGVDKSQTRELSSLLRRLPREFEMEGGMDGG